MSTGALLIIGLILAAAFVALVFSAIDGRHDYLNECDRHEVTRRELELWKRVVSDAGLRPPMPEPPPIVAVWDGSKREWLRRDGQYLQPAKY